MTDIRLKEATENESEFIAFLQSLPDTELQKRLIIIREQEQIAFNQKNDDSLQLLQLWEQQVIRARYLRNESEDIKSQKKSILKKMKANPQKHPFALQSLYTVIEKPCETVSSSQQLLLF